MALGIGVGTVVSLHGTRYIVVAAKHRKGKYYPSTVKVVNTLGEVNSNEIVDVTDDWWHYNWEIVSGAVEYDDKAPLYEKIRYLDKKFKDKQTLKAKAKQPKVTATTTIDYEGLVWQNIVHDELQAARVIRSSEIRAAQEEMPSNYIRTGGTGTADSPWYQQFISRMGGR